MSRDAGALIFAVAFPTAAAWLYFVTFADAAFMPAIYSSCKVVQFAFPLVWVLLHRSEYQGRPAAASRGITMGTLSGLAIVILMWTVYLTVIKDSGLALAAQPRIAARIAAMGAASPARFIALTLFVSVVHSFLEEYYWRWFVFDRMRTYCGGSLAVVLSSVAFTGHHVIVLHAFIGPGPYWWVTVVLSIGVALGGGLWAWLYARNGTLFSPWLSHTLVDLGIMAIGYNLSGGFTS